jgi:pimeloyl-ACP methyl ester carboxylesterase
VVAADRDALRGLDESRELRDGIPGATMAVVEGSGHMIPIERPTELAAIVVPWLRERAVSASR